MRSPWKPLPKHDFGAHFLTAKTFENTPYFRNSTCARIFCEELEAARATYGFHILAFVVMPDHIHLLLWWDTGVAISKIAWAVKGRAARRIVAHLKGLVDVNSRVADGHAAGHPQGHPEDEGRVGGGIAFIHPAPSCGLSGRRWISPITVTGNTKSGSRGAAMISTSTLSTNFWKRSPISTLTRCGLVWLLRRKPISGPAREPTPGCLLPPRYK